MSLPYSFWTDVEKKLKYVLYGDSVAESSKITIKFKFDNHSDETLTLPIGEAWQALLDGGYIVTLYDDKEYIFLNKHIEILTSNSGGVVFSRAKYLMRHNFIGKLIKLETKYESVMVTRNHSVINIDTKGEFTKVDPCVANYLLVHNGNELQSAVITNRYEQSYVGYVYDFEVPETHNFIADNILVHNTDSIYINLPVDSNDIENSMVVSQDIAIEVNDLIHDFLNEYILSKMNIEPQYNFTFFKTELTAHSIIFLETKKNYAFKATSVKNKILPKPKVEYVGIPIVKVSTPLFSSEFIRALTEDIALTDVSKVDIQEKLNNVAKVMWVKLLECIKDCNIAYIGSPGKWNTTKNDNSHVTGMRLYNSLTNSETFKPMVSGYSIGIRITNYSLIESRISSVSNNSTLYFNKAITGINFISIPYGYDPEAIKKLFIDYDISIDKESLWDSLYNTVAKRITEVIKAYSISK